MGRPTDHPPNAAGGSFSIGVGPIPPAPFPERKATVLAVKGFGGLGSMLFGLVSIALSMIVASATRSGLPSWVPASSRRV